MQDRIIDLTKTESYKAMMRPIVEAHRPLLAEMGYDPDTQWELCEWLVYHLLKSN
jgi:hypothetical protein